MLRRGFAGSGERLCHFGCHLGSHLCVVGGGLGTAAALPLLEGSFRTSLERGGAFVADSPAFGRVDCEGVLRLPANRNPVDWGALHLHLWKPRSSPRASESCEPRRRRHGRCRNIQFACKP